MHLVYVASPCLAAHQANPGHKAVINATINARVLTELARQPPPSISSIIVPPQIARPIIPDLAGALWPCAADWLCSSARARAPAIHGQ